MSTTKCPLEGTVVLKKFQNKVKTPNLGKHESFYVQKELFLKKMKCHCFSDLAKLFHKARLKKIIFWPQ